jgi:hypothetical protein
MRPHHLLLALITPCLLISCKAIDYRGPAIKVGVGYNGFDVSVTLFQTTKTDAPVISLTQEPDPKKEASK